MSLPDRWSAEAGEPRQEIRLVDMWLVQEATARHSALTQSPVMA